MKTLLLCGSLVCLLLCAFAPSVRQSPRTGWVTTADFTRELDGDTAIFEVTHQLRIRLKDCWCGETDAKDVIERRMGLEAKNYLHGLAADVPGKWTIEIPTDGMRDGDIADINTLGRWVGNVYLPLPDGRCVNDLLVEKKLAGRTKAELKRLIEARRQ